MDQNFLSKSYSYIPVADPEGAAPGAPPPPLKLEKI
jgi:hypothetical protein